MCLFTNYSVAKCTIDDLAQELADHASNGYMVVKVGFGKAGEANLGVDNSRDITYVHAMREVISNDVYFVIDLGKKTRWNYASGLRMAREFE